MDCRAFTALTPDVILDAVEAVTGLQLAGFTHPLNSYINRVYELQSAQGERIIAKFYRPGRWSLDALKDEHVFVRECAEEEIPVVPPEILQDGTTLGKVEDIYFAVFEKRRGREFEVIDEDGWRRLGRILGRMHLVGQRASAPSRLVMHPDLSTRSDITYLHDRGWVASRHRQAFFAAAEAIMEYAIELFEDVPLQRIHGDCHCQNILERPDVGLMLIDFDDMAMGPAVQDMWMLLPDHPENCHREINLMLEGYEDFLEFDDRALRLVEALRAMRMLYYLAWCGKQKSDPNFDSKFPDWGNDSFWRQQVSDLERQLAIMRQNDGNRFP